MWEPSKVRLSSKCHFAQLIFSFQLLIPGYVSVLPHPSQYFLCPADIFFSPNKENIEKEIGAILPVLPLPAKLPPLLFSKIHIRRCSYSPSISSIWSLIPNTFAESDLWNICSTCTVKINSFNLRVIVRREVNNTFLTNC